MSDTHSQWRGGTSHLVGPDVRPISLLLRHITQVFDEPDPLRRRRIMKQIYLPTSGIAGADVAILGRAVGAGSGMASIDAGVDRLFKAFPGYQFTVSDCAAIGGRIGCIKWHFGPASHPQFYNGVDIAVCEQDRIKTLCSLREEAGSDAYDVEDICRTLDQLSVETASPAFLDPWDCAARKRVRRALGGGTSAAPPLPPGRRPFVVLAIDRRRRGPMP